MRTEQEVKKQLKAAEKALRSAERRFQRYDNHDDSGLAEGLAVDIIPVVQQEIETLKWVLSK